VVVRYQVRLGWPLPPEDRPLGIWPRPSKANHPLRPSHAESYSSEEYWDEGIDYMSLISISLNDMKP
jgi:hypothetical protein